MIRDRERYEKRVGTVVDGRWRIDTLLGRGSTAAVYAATHRNGHRATLKILHPTLCAEPALVERFLREAGIANAIKHRAIVPIGDDGTTEDGCAYLVLELLDGESLDDIKERGGGRIPLEDLAPMADEMMSAISAVHAAGVIHRDLKPGNVFITTDKKLKLLDFGTARIFDRAGDSKLSMQGLVLGTPSFMSPEQAKGIREEVDAQSDVWSLGAMLFTLLSGELVHEGVDDHQRLLNAAIKPARSLASVAPSIDGRVITVVDRALMYAKHDRWSDVRSMRSAFRAAVLASVPTLRDLKAYADVTVEEEEQEEEVPMPSLSSDPTIVMDAPPEMEQLRRAPAPEPAPALAPAVAAPPVATPPRARKSSRIPVLALIVGLSAMSAVIALVVFFVMGGDVSTGRSGSVFAPVPSAEVTPGTVAAPSSSFIVITAPDLPETKPKLPAWATAPMPKAAPVTNKSVPPKVTSTSAAGSASAAPADPGAVSPPATAPVTPPAPSEKPATGGPRPDDPGF